MENSASSSKTKRTTRTKTTDAAVTKATEAAECAASASVVAVHTPKPIVPKEIDASQYVIVRNGFQGTLVYKSPRTGERFVWEHFGDEQEMELRELRNAKSSSKRFFEANWFMFDEDWIIDYLGVRQYYKHALPIDNFDSIFKKKPDELKTILSNLSQGQKRSVAYRAKELIEQKKIDSVSVISVLEDSLGIALIER